MATALPVLEREKVNNRTESSLKAYGKLSGAAEPAPMTEEQKALKFNSRISQNYQNLINPDLKKAEDIMGGAVEAPAYETPEAYARATLYPERTEESAPRFQHQRVTEDLFRADSPINAPRMDASYEAVDFAQPVFAPQQEYTQQPEFAPQQEYAQQSEQAFAEETNEDLKPTATTIQYRSELYSDEKRTVVEEKKGYALTAKGKLLLAIYAVVVVIVLALIIVNTSVLKNIDTETAAYEAQLNESIARAEKLAEDIEVATSYETITEWGINNGMYFAD